MLLIQNCSHIHIVNKFIFSFSSLFADRLAWLSLASSLLLPHSTIDAGMFHILQSYSMFLHAVGTATALIDLLA